METPQDALARVARERGESLSALSRLLGRNVAYLGQYVRRGSPRVLPERERALLADYLAVDEGMLGAPQRRDEVALVPQLDVRASAGPGAAVAGERALAPQPFARATLRRAGVAPEAASVIRVAGDSMAPGLLDGDSLLVDRAALGVPRGGAVFVIRMDALLWVKRLVPAPGGWEVRSDNPAYPPQHRPGGEVDIIGRARLVLRDLG